MCVSFRYLLPTFASQWTPSLTPELLVLHSLSLSFTSCVTAACCVSALSSLSPANPSHFLSHNPAQALKLLRLCHSLLQVKRHALLRRKPSSRTERHSIHRWHLMKCCFRLLMPSEAKWTSLLQIISTCEFTMSGQRMPILLLTRCPSLTTTSGWSPCVSLATLCAACTTELTRRARSVKQLSSHLSSCITASFAA